MRKNTEMIIPGGGSPDRSSAAIDAAAAVGVAGSGGSGGPDSADANAAADIGTSLADADGTADGVDEEDDDEEEEEEEEDEVAVGGSEAGISAAGGNPWRRPYSVSASSWSNSNTCMRTRRSLSRSRASTEGNEVKARWKIIGEGQNMFVDCTCFFRKHENSIA